MATQPAVPAALPRWRAPLVPVPGWARHAATGAGMTSLAIVVVLWAGGGGLTDLDGAPAERVSAVARLCGLLSADLLLLQVVLMARVPVLERAYGQDRLTWLHRGVGTGSVALLAVHVAGATLAHAAGPGGSLSGTLGRAAPVFWRMLLTVPWLGPALSATLLLLVVAVTSGPWLRRRLRYELWHLLHLYAYVGIGLSIPHEVWAGRDFVHHRLTRAYWWSAYAAAAGCVLVFRLGVPLYRSWRHRLVVEEVVPERTGAVSVYLTGRDLRRLRVAAGQYFVFRFLGSAGWTRGHPYSLSAAPQRRRLRITMAATGDDAARLRRLRPGTRVLIEGPYGRLHHGVRTRRKVTLVAGGVGITPLRALLEELSAEPGEVTLVHRTSSREDALFADELAAMAAGSGARLFRITGSRAQRGGSWLPDAASHLTDVEALCALVPDIAEHEVFVCGPGPWADAVLRAAVAAGVPRRHVHSEHLGW